MQCVPNVFQITFPTTIFSPGPHAICGKGKTRYFLSGFKMKKSRPRVVFLNFFITRDPFHCFTTTQPPLGKPLVSALRLLSRNSSLSSSIRVTRECRFLLNTKELGLPLSSLSTIAVFTLGDPLRGKGPFSPDFCEILQRLYLQGVQGPQAGNYFPRQIQWFVKGTVARGGTRTRSKGLNPRPGLQPTRPLGREGWCTLRHTGTRTYMCKTAAEPNADSRKQGC